MNGLLTGCRMKIFCSVRIRWQGCASKNILNVNKADYKSMIVKSAFDVENILLNNPELMDLRIPDPSLKKYDNLMG